MALNEITKGMSNAAEMINSNFKNVGVINSESNTDGTFIELENGIVLVFGHKEFVDNNGWGVGKNRSFDSNTIPSAYKSPLNIIFSSYNAEIYDSASAFYDIQTRVSKINAISGNVEVIKHNGNVRNTQKMVIRYFYIGNKK